MQPPRRQPLRPALVAAAVAAFGTAGAMTSACSSSNDDDRYVHCVDANGRVVDPTYCDDDDPRGTHSGSYWYYASKKRHKAGAKVPSDWVSSRISPSDYAARVRAGLPGTGKIGGTKVSSKGFGKSGSGSGGS